MVQTFSDGVYVYSVDMMFAYINLFSKSLEIKKISVSEISYNLKFKGWGDIFGKKYSAMDVINYPNKYKEDYSRIQKANLSYPIILYGNDIVDGVHRLSKSIIENKRYIKAYVFDKNLLKKFRLGKMPKTKDGWMKIENKSKPYNLIEYFYKNFNE